MLYPPLEEGHEVLGQEYCSGYSDIHGKWNTGFYCPPIIPDVPVFCCGTVVLKYCCTLGKPIPGGHYTKGYDVRHSDHEEEEPDLDQNPESEHPDLISDIPTVPSSEDVGDFSQRSLLIGIVCGLFAMVVLMTIVSCFYCSCCVLYKKRRGRQLSGGGLLYGIPASSSSTTTCGLLNSFSNAATGNTGIVTTAGNPANSGCSSTTTATLPNFITTTSPLNPLVDYWSSTGGGSSNSSSCGVATGGGASSTVIVAATATSLSPPNIMGGPPAPHHIHHGSVYHHHHHYTTSSPIIGPVPPGAPLMVAPVQHLEPPPPYLAIASQQNAANGPCCDSMTAGVVRTPQRTNSRGSSGSNTASQNANLLIQRQLTLLQNAANSVNMNTTGIIQTTTGSPANNNLGNAQNSGETGSHGNSPSISLVNSSPAITNGNPVTSTSGVRGSLPPPYFVEQYRIRNRVRPPPVLGNAGGGSANSDQQRSRAQETIHNLLYPLLNSAAISSSRGHGNNEAGRRRHVDTQSEPRRSHHHHHHHPTHSHNRNVGVGGGSSGGGGGGPGLHRSSSDRQERSVGGGAGSGCYMAGNTDEGVVVLNNLINNLSATRGSMGRNSSGRTTSSGTRTATTGRLTSGSVGGSEEIRRPRGESSVEAVVSGESGGRLALDNFGKILNTEVVLQHRQQRQAERHARRSTRDHHNIAAILPQSSSSCSSTAAVLSSLGRLSSSSSRHRSGSRNRNNESENCIEMNSTMSSGSQRSRDNSRDNGTEEEDELNENMSTLTTEVATANDNDNDGDVDDDDEDIIMMEGDEEDEVIAVVTTTRHHRHHRHHAADDEEVDEEEEGVVDIIDELVMGFGEEEEEYLVEEENSEENSTDKLSESAPNSSMSVDASHNPVANVGSGDNGDNKRGTGSPSSFLMAEKGEGGTAGEESDHHQQHLRKHLQPASNNDSETSNASNDPACVHPVVVSVVGFLTTNSDQKT